MKKLLSLGIAVCIIIVTSFPVYSESTDTVTVKGGTVKLSVLGGDDQNEDQDDKFRGPYDALDVCFPNLEDDPNKIEEIENCIYNGLINCDTEIDVSDYEIPLKVIGFVSAENNDGCYTYNEKAKKYVIAQDENRDFNGEYDLFLSSDDFSALLNNLVWSKPDIFMFNAGRCAFDYNVPYEISDSSECAVTVNCIYPSYKYEIDTKNEYLQKLSFCEKEIQKIINGMDKSFNDFEKVIYVHEYFVSNFAYDTEGCSYDEDENNWQNNDYPKSIGDMYGFFSEKRAVCQGYALAFKAVMDKLDIKNNTTVVSIEDNHIWNMVEINGKYYHIDCTQDDPLKKIASKEYDIKGYVSHKYLFLSDEEIKDEHHHSWYTEPAYNNTITCTDNTYDNADWKSVGGKLCYFGDYWYSASSSLPTNILRFDGRTLGNMPSTTIESEWTGNLPYRGVVQCGDTIFFNEPDRIVSYNIQTGDTSKIAQWSVSDLNTSSGCYYDGNGQLGYYYDNDYANTAENFYDLKVGDIDRDGNYNGTDLANLISYILGKDNDTYFNEFFADATFDNIVDIRDIVALKNLIANQS